MLQKRCRECPLVSIPKIEADILELTGDRILQRHELELGKGAAPAAGLAKH
jgi:hypothetical protein